MLRQLLVYGLVAFLCVYATRYWFRSLCGSILLLAILEHPDMPRSLFGIQGLSPWNILLVFVLFFWLLNRKREGLTWDLPNDLRVWLYLYVLIIVIAFLRMIVDTGGITDYAIMMGRSSPSQASLFSEFFINSIKWLIPAALVYHGCRTKERLNLVLVTVLALYFILSIQVIKWMPVSLLTDGDALAERALRILGKEVGYHRVDLSMMMATAFWAFVVIRPVVKNAVLRAAMPICAIMCLVAQALTGGRAGFVTWIGIGVVIAAVKWKRYLIYGPVVLLMIVLLMPAVTSRFTQGFGGENIDTRQHDVDTGLSLDDGSDLYTITAGRIIAWPVVIDRIKDRPFFGIGRRGMQRSGAAQELWIELRESFPHPHNAYLQFLLDTGIVGLFVLGALVAKLILIAVKLIREKSCPECVMAGGLALVTIFGLCFAAIGSQTFYPRESSVPIFVAIALMLRVHVNKSRADDREIVLQVTNRSDIGAS